MSTYDDRTDIEREFQAKSERERQIAQGKIDGLEFESTRITGWVAHAINKGINPNIDIPLVSHVEGNLWQGGCKHNIRLPDDFLYVVSLYPWEKYRIGLGTARWEYRMYDSLDQATEQVDEIAKHVVALCDAGKTLVHCQAGLNRSGLVTARALMFMGYSADDAIKKLRDGRCSLVLCNDTFEDYLKSL